MISTHRLNDAEIRHVAPTRLRKHGNAIAATIPPLVFNELPGLSVGTDLTVYAEPGKLIFDLRRNPDAPTRTIRSQGPNSRYITIPSDALAVSDLPFGPPLSVRAGNNLIVLEPWD